MTYLTSRRWRGALAAAVVVTVVLAGSAGSAGAATTVSQTQLVVSSSSIAPLGWHSAANSATSARNLLKAGLSRSLGKLVKGAQVQAAGASMNGQKLASDAFSFLSSGTAHKVLAAYKRKHHASRLALGADGSMWQQQKGGSVVYTLVWRRGANVALLQMEVPKKLKNGLALVLAMAKLADAALQTPVPASAFGKIASQINPDGSVPPQVALEGFALAYGGLPGVQVPSGTQSLPPLDGTSVAAWVLQNLSSYSPQIQAAIWAKLGLTPPGAARDASLGDPNFTPDAALTATANGWATTYPGLLGTGALKYTVVAGNTTAFNGTLTNADAFPVDAQGRYNINGPNCRIRFNVSKNTAMSGPFKSYVLAHEMFHCFQFMIAGASWTGIKTWTLEATAEWAALTETTPAWNSQFPNGDSRWMIINMQQPQTPLFTRTYDAVDFWGHVQDTYGDLFKRMKTILTSSGNDAIFNAAGANADNFLYSWASSLVDGNGGGAAWHLTSPIAVPNGSGVTPTNITFNASSPITNITVPAYTTKYFIVQSSATAPLVHIKIKGHARFSSMHDYTTQLKDGWFCVAGSAASCQCPNGSSGNVPAGYPTDNANELAIVGDPKTGSAGSVTYAQLNTFCKAIYKVPNPQPDVLRLIASGR
jgi:hypothetical protein